MRVLKVLFLSLAVAALYAAPALAGVSGTVHDIDAFKGSDNTAQGGACSYCHIPHGAKGDKLWPSPRITGLTGWKATQIGNLCWSCHVGTDYATAAADTPFDTSSHARDNSLLIDQNDGRFEGDLSAMYTGVASDNDGYMSCTSCHNPHENTNRPFQAHGLNASLQNLCEKCHLERRNPGTAGGSAELGATNNSANSRGSMHPNNVLPESGDTNKRTFLATFDNAFRVAYGAVARGTATGGWDLGGHYSAGDTGNVVCASCHAVHGNEGTASGAIPNSLLVLDQAPATHDNAVLCQGCHNANPGKSATSTHPVNTDNAVWGVSITKPTNWPFGTRSAKDVINCSTCHDMHFARANSALWRVGSTSDNVYGSYCGECHNSSATTWEHHPSNVVLTEGTNVRSDSGWPRISRTGSDLNWDNVSAANAWNPAGTERYTLGAGNVMNCGTCHAGGNANAHNNAGSFPGVVGTAVEAEMCVDCHGFNPSQYTASRGTGTSSNNWLGTHYLGRVITSGYKRTTVFGSSAILPLYSYDVADNAVTCKSCHSILKDSSLGAGAHKQVSDNDNVAYGPTTATSGAGLRNVKLLIEKSGNGAVASAANYLCTACHGVSPGTAGSSSHPVYPTYTTAVSAAVTGDVGTTDNVTIATGSYVNCESCHRPHDAASKGGAVILEGVGATSAKNPMDRASSPGYLDQEGLCTLCHASK